MDDWKTIWNNRKYNNCGMNLDALIRVDGFDSGANSFDARSWVEYVDFIEKKAIQKGTESIF